MDVSLNIEPKEWLEEVRKEVVDSPFLSKFSALTRHLEFVYEDEPADDSFSKVTCPWTVTREYFDENSADYDVLARIRKLTAIQVGNDLADLIADGDVDSDDALHRAMDGYKKLGAKCGASPKLFIRDFNVELRKVLNVTKEWTVGEHPIEDEDWDRGYVYGTPAPEVKYLITMWLKLDLDMQSVKYAA